MLLVVSKGRTTHVIEITDFGRKAVQTTWCDKDKQDFVEGIDEVLWFEPANRTNEKNIINGRPVSGAVYLSRWEWVYVLEPELIHQRPLSNARWVKRPSR